MNKGADRSAPFLFRDYSIDSVDLVLEVVDEWILFVRPLFLRDIDAEFDHVTIGIVNVEGVHNNMIDTVGNARTSSAKLAVQAAQGVFIRNVEADMEESRVLDRGKDSLRPDLEQSQVVCVFAGAVEPHASPLADKLKAQHLAIERVRRRKVSDFQNNMVDSAYVHNFEMMTQRKDEANRLSGDYRDEITVG